MRTLIAPAGLTAAVLLTALAAPAQAVAPSAGCPSGFQRLEVAPLTSAGYRVPALVDSPDQNLSFGHVAGNGNGFVCAVPLGNQQFDGLQIYNFFDDSLLSG